jgi:hypothetical protein
MGRINYARVILGGLLAGLVINISEFLLNGVVFAKEMEDAMLALNRPMDNTMIVWFTALGFALGILAVWLYAAIRPRFSAGAKTAACAGLAVWFLSYVYPSAVFWVMHLFPRKLIAVGTLWGLPEILIATVAGAWLYKE